MNHWIAFGVGVVIGALLGVLFAGLCYVAREADEAIRMRDMETWR